MKRLISLLLAAVLVFGMIPFGAAAETTAETINTPSGTVLRGDQYIRDPFILCDNGVYYMYGSIAYGQFEVFSSTDLLNWTTYSEPAFKAAEDSWVHEASQQTVSGVEPGYWAPEVYKLAIDGETAYYMIATFTQNKEPYNQQVSAIMKADNPLGPFEPWSVDENGDIAPITPDDGCSYMDATLYYQDGVPYLVYVHEWQCSCRDYDGIGSMGYVQLSDDLKATVGEHTEWFNTYSLYAYNTDLFEDNVPGVTDGPEVYTDANGQHYLLWSTHFLDKESGEQVYTQLATKFDKLGDTLNIINMKDRTLLLYANNGGHGMIFTDFDGNEKMILHTPSNSKARASIFNVVVTDEGIALATYTVSGTVAGGMDGTVTAIRKDGDKHIFKYALVDGSYEIDLPDGTYDLYFDCGDRDGMVTDVTVNGGAVTAPTLTKTYQKLTVYKDGTAGTADWVMTANGCYEVQTSNTNVNAVSMGYFVDGVDMAATDFVIHTNVEAAGTNSTMIGLAISGTNAADSVETAVFGLNNKNDTAQIRVMNENLWLGYQSVAAYDRTSFHLTILKQGTTITYYIDGVEAVQWTTSDYDFGSWTETKVGLGFYRMFDVTFSQYSYSTDAADVTDALNRTVTVNELPEGVTVTADGSPVISGASYPYGTEVTVNCPNDGNGDYTLTVNGQVVELENNCAVVTLTESVQIQVTAVYSYLVSGTLGENVSGTVIATDLEGVQQVFTDALINGSYSIRLADGTYKLYFDCGDTEGLIPAVTVSGAEVTANLSKTYQKLTSLKYGDSGTANWVLTDNGRYKVQTSNASADSISMGWFENGITMADTDFVIETNVEAAGTNNVMIGLAVQGINANGAQRTLVYGLNNANYTAQCRVMENNTWPGQRTISYEYDRTNFRVKYVKQGSTITCYVDGEQVAQWTSSSSDFVFMGLTDAKVGIGIYRMYDVTFSDYSYEASYAVSGTVADNANGTVVATNADGEEQVFENALVDGSYSISLADGTYSLYFDCGDYEGFIPEVTVSGAEVTANLSKTYQKLTSLKYGDAGTANWVMTGNGRYEVQTSNASADSISMGWFKSGITMADTDFVIETNVEAAGANNVMIGLAVQGINANGAQRTLVYGLNNANYTAQCRVIENNTWPGQRTISYEYDRTNFHIKYVKQGSTITCYVDGQQAAQWTSSSSDFVFMGLTDAKVGIGIYRMYDVTFSNYSYTETKAEVNKWNLVLDDDLKVNYYLNLDRYTAADANVNITVGGDTVSYKASELKVENGLYVASINIAAAQMTDEIAVSVVNGEKTLFSKNYTVRGYCDTILVDEAYSAYHALIKEMLAYGGAAQTYFGYNTDYLASDGITDTGAAAVPEAAETEMVISGEADGIRFYGASLVFRDKIAVRFYFTGSSEGVEGAVVKDDMFYIEVADILPQDLDEAVTVTVDGLMVSYSPMNYMVRMNEKGSENLQVLLKALYNYHLAAKALRT